eukprot:CAMPEP_0202837924 /NCGR_PEP_ID=MMETSP1389-20130828/47567_1 /ASSEMBLY_ACC=CAM_ASM_000865 /TAXON_ID=302021 /ORGANISM="Rhodomonas sp., Strain CCMP768" /LENGTH=184 /DNA_ID=CAMNT_0049514083 /DNA_START=544 /DNA_END=1098 /DNA_ORIENTATION=-
MGSLLEEAVGKELRRLRAWEGRSNAPRIAVHVRTGDKTMKVGSSLGVLEYHWPRPVAHSFVDCALALERRLGLYNSTIFFFSDSLEVKEEAERYLPGRVYASKTSAKHTDRMRSHGRQALHNALSGALSDVFIAAMASGMVASRSGFSDIVIEFGGFPIGSTISQLECMAMNNVSADHVRTPNL